MKNKKGNISPFILILIPVVFGLVYLATQSQLPIASEKYSASLHFQMPTFQVVVKSVVALLTW